MALAAVPRAATTVPPWWPATARSTPAATADATKPPDTRERPRRIRWVMAASFRGGGQWPRPGSGPGRCSARPGSSLRRGSPRQLLVQFAGRVEPDRPLTFDLPLRRHPPLREVGGVELGEALRGHRSRLLPGGRLGAV